MKQVFKELAKSISPFMVHRFCLEISMETLLQPILKEREEKYVPSMRTFRDYVDGMVSHNAWCKRDEIVIKVLYLLGSRVSEVVTKTTPYMLNHHLSQSYGVLLRHEIGWYNHRVEVDGKLVMKREPLLLVHSAIAKMKLVEEKQPETSPKDPSVPPTLLVPMKIVALPCFPQYEPWTRDLLHWVDPTKHTNPRLSFAMVQDNVQRIVKQCLSGLRDIDPKVTELHPHMLRHWRVGHLRLNYHFTSLDECAYIGWSIRSREANRGQNVSANLDTYSHLSWRDYIEKLLVPIDDVL
jgi:hypothetical protein